MEALVRVGVFLGIFCIMVLWEYWRPRRMLSRPRRERWVTNLGLTAFNSILVRATVGGVTYAAAVFAAEREMGLLHWLGLPPWAAGGGTLLGVDLPAHPQHLPFHAWPARWRLPRVPPA